LDDQKTFYVSLCIETRFCNGASVDAGKRLAGIKKETHPITCEFPTTSLSPNPQVVHSRSVACKMPIPAAKLSSAGVSSNSLAGLTFFTRH
jgi:hypothetical protein